MIQSNFKPSVEPLAFNMGLATLERINNLLIHLAESHIESDIIRCRNTLIELFKECFVYMQKEEKQKGLQYLEELMNFFLTVKDSSTIKYDAKIILFMNEFDLYLRSLLSERGVLMPNLGKMKGLDKLKKSYNMEKENAIS